MQEDQVADDNGISENDTPGASLSGQDPSMLTVPVFKHWLLCRAAPTILQGQES